MLVILFLMSDCQGNERGKQTQYRYIKLKKVGSHASTYQLGIHMTITFTKCILQDAQLSQRDRTAGCVIVFAKSRTLELGDNDLRTL